MIHSGVNMRADIERVLEELEGYNLERKTVDMSWYENHSYNKSYADREKKRIEEAYKKKSWLINTDRREAFVRNVLGYANGVLLEETIQLAGGDDYDGCFTEEGNWQYQVLKAELESRLRAVGFLEFNSLTSL